jgi:hypothetical protein
MLSGKQDGIMTPQERKALAHDAGVGTLRLRDDAKRLAEEARQRGDEKEARAFERQLPKLNKLIADYGLERYAHRP